MLTSSTIDLRWHGNWSVGQLLSEDFAWPAPGPTIALGELVTRIAPDSFAEANTPVITPANVESQSGSVRRRSRRYQGTTYQVGSEIQPGDLLVPRTPSGATLLVSGRLMGAAVSSGFYALRPLSESRALWLWAVLNSRSGLNLRSRIAIGASSKFTNLGDLLEMQLPLFAQSRLAAITPTLGEMEEGTHLEEEEAPETWWRIAELRGAEWRFMLASPHPEALDEGMPLKDYCSQIVEGRPVRDIAIEIEEPGFLPVVDARMLSGGPARRWVPPNLEHLTLVRPGDLCLTSVGPRPHATVLQVEAVAGPTTHVLRLREPSLGPALAKYLNGSRGFAMRRLLTSGATIPRLTRRDLEALPVRDDLLDKLGQYDPVQLPIADRLEGALWPS